MSAFEDYYNYSGSISKSNGGTADYYDYYDMTDKTNRLTVLNDIKIINNTVLNNNYHNDIIDYICDFDNTYNGKKRLSGLSIIISAYNTANFIEQTLSSINSQEWCQQHNNYEILIGIDGCTETLSKVKEIMFKYKNIYAYYMPENKGTFVTANTLISLAKYDKIMRFDSDDFFIDDKSLGKVINCLDDHDMVRYWFTDFWQENNKKSPIKFFALGSVLFKTSILEKAGGYQDWLCSGDYEFYERIKNNIDIFELEDYIYYHRVWEGSLMNDPKTKMGSEYREELNDKIKKYDFKKGDNIYIKPVVNDYEEIMPDDSVIVSMTSWSKRIDNVAKVLGTIFVNSKQPDRIIINLAISEFPDKFGNLPEDLIKLITANKVSVNWVKNNTLVWKKSVPIIVKFKKSWVICIDDDFLYPNYFIQTMIETRDKNPGLPITGCMSPHRDALQHCGCASMDRYDMLWPYLYCITNDIYKAGDEDTFFTVCYRANGIIMKNASRTFHSNMVSFNSSEGYSSNYHIMPGNNWDLIRNTFFAHDVEFVTVNYNTPDLIDRLLTSFKNECKGNYHFRIIDGSDKENFIAEVDKVAKKYDAEIEHMKYNIHHGPGMDYALNTSKYKYVFIVDSDMVFTYNIENALTEMIDMNKAITGFCEQVNRDGVNVNHKFINYVHPRYQLVNVDMYKQICKAYNVKYVKHGAPCIQVMTAIYDNKKESELLGYLPEEKRKMMYKTEESGTCHRFGINL